MTTNSYEIGDRVRLRTSTPFQDSSAVAFDPTVVKFEVKAPDVATVTYTYGTSSNVSKIATGDYACDIDVDGAGVWSYYIIGETAGGENRGADQGSFFVQEKLT